jgi:hypothetical protein
VRCGFLWLSIFASRCLSFGSAHTQKKTWMKLIQLKILHYLTLSSWWCFFSTSINAQTFLKLQFNWWTLRYFRKKLFLAFITFKLLVIIHFLFHSQWISSFTRSLARIDPPNLSVYISKKNEGKKEVLCYSYSFMSDWLKRMNESEWKS